MFEYWVETELTQLAPVRNLQGVVFSKDDGANRIGVVVKDGGEPINLSGTVTASVILPDGSTITLNGSKTANKAYVDLTDDVYDTPGRIGVFIHLTNGSEKCTLGGIEAYVQPSRIGNIIS